MPGPSLLVSCSRESIPDFIATSCEPSSPGTEDVTLDRETPAPVIHIHTATYVVLALALTAVPIAAAEEPPQESPEEPSTLRPICYDVRPGEFPPIIIYECPGGD